MSGKTITITMRISEQWIEALREIARREAYKAHEDISYQDLIKKAVYEKYLKEK